MSVENHITDKVARELIRRSKVYVLLKEAALAGARYSDALYQIQQTSPDLMGKTVTADDLDTLLKDWHDKTHAALDADEKTIATGG